MEDRWAEVDGPILDSLAAHGAMTPGDLARRLGISEGEATAFLAMLVREGKIRMCLVELAAA